MWIRRFQPQLRKLSDSIPVKRKYNASKWTTGSGLVTSLGAAWYYYEYWHHVELSPDYFTKYRISYNGKIDSDHFVLELIPLKRQRKNWWKTMTSDRVWSVEIKQPEIMVVRNYTPLPLEHVGGGRLQVFPDDEHRDGKLLFYMKKYQYGEVARWLSSLPEGYQIELRGPYLDHRLQSQTEKQRDRRYLSASDSGDLSMDQFSHQPYDIATFTAGTGIAPIMQILLTEYPFAGRILFFHSCRTEKELGPLLPILERLQHANRLELHLFSSQSGRDLRNNSEKVLSLIPTPTIYQQRPFDGFGGPLRPILSLVCGPDGYISTVSGVKFDLSQGPVGGLLAEKGWNNSNVFKFS
ncbi:LADA_0A02322g1_1 [Lachancea dasiensis]|uniref:LADA_0A02322g1_1 n=1 Tax=Lachancea dasiensis TaxID=1072105 RepID=A0A1G4IN14_9SACH|nr:LADA_0A02322g1_1 [Lachancea dasiensis]